MTLRRALLVMFMLCVSATVSANEKFYRAMERGDLVGALHILRTDEIPSLDSPRLLNLLAVVPNDAANVIVNTIKERLRAFHDENDSSTQPDGRDHGNFRYPKQVEALAAQMPEPMRKVFLFGVQFGQSCNKYP